MHGKVIKDSGFKRMRGADLGLEWLETDDTAMLEPVVVESPEGLGMKMPPKHLTVDDIAQLVGVDTPVEVIGIQVYVHARHHVTLSQMLLPSQRLLDGR